MAERISRRKFLVLASAGTGAVVAGAFGARELLSSGNGEGKAAVVKSPTAEPTKKPTATETIAPTPTTKPTEVPTVVPTEVPVETPATIEEVRDAFFGEFGAYSKLDDATRASLPTNQSQAYIEERLGICNGDIAIPDNPPENPFHAYALIDACINIPQNINGIPGREDILEFSVAQEKLASFTLAKVDELYQAGKLFMQVDGQNVPLSEDKFVQYRSEVSAYFPK